MSHRALITGVSGFAGSFLAEHLLACGDSVLGCTPHAQWLSASPATLAERVPLVAWDFGDQQGLTAESRRRIEKFRPDRIYHLAALSVPADCGRDEPSAEAWTINVEGTRKVLELAGWLDSRPRVLFISSARVYAPVRPESSVIDESAPLGPIHPYGRTKLAAEEEVAQAIERLGCDAVIARAFQHTGPRQSPRMMLPQWVQQFAVNTSEPVEVLTCDAQIDVTDVRDTVRAYRLLTEKGRCGVTYNVGSGKAQRSGDVLELLRQMADPGRPIKELAPGFKQDPIADITRLTDETGWNPTVPIEQTVADTWTWWRENPS